MSTQFETGFVNDDPIEVTHVTQFAEPIQDLESGAAWYRPDTGVANAHVVDFSNVNENGIDTTSLADGQIIHFKASAVNTGATTLTVNGTSSSSTTKSITKNGGSALDAGDIQANQMVAVIYNSEGGGRFELVGGIGGTGGSATVGVGEVGFGDSAGALTSDPAISVSSGQLNLTNGISSLGINGISEQFGQSSQASGSGSLAVGNNAVSSGVSSTALGRLAKCEGYISTAVGVQAESYANSGVSLGYYAQSGEPAMTHSYAGAIAIGGQAKALQESCVALGYYANASTLRAISLGTNANGSGVQAMALGFYTVASAESAIALGAYANASTWASVAIGRTATVTGSYAVAVGSTTISSSYGSTACGYQSEATGYGSVAIGNLAKSQGAYSLSALEATAAHNYSMALGKGAVTTDVYQAVLGGPVGVIQDLYVGSGVTHTGPSDVNIRATGASGTDAAPAQMRIAGGISTGSASGGSVKIATSPAGASGSSPNALVDHLVIDGEGRIGFHGATPVAQSTGWIASNVTASTSIDASTATLAELRQFVGTMANSLKDLGLLGA